MDNKDEQIKKLTTRLWVGLFLLFIILTASIIMFANLYYEQLALAALSGDYTNKTSGSILTADEWNNLDEDFGSSVPAGAIIMWSGTLATIPAGWQSCDGSGGTPDLRNRFIVGAGSSYSTGNTGGNNTVILSIDQMPNHTHGLTLGGGSSGPRDAISVDAAIAAWHSYGPESTDASGSSNAHENRPPYYALVYICKL
jgi:microcystin-dependent protein